MARIILEHHYKLNLEEKNSDEKESVPKSVISEMLKNPSLIQDKHLGAEIKLTEIDSQSQSQSLRSYQVPPKQLTPPQSTASSRFKLPSPVLPIEPDNTTRSFTFNPGLSPPSPHHQELPDLSSHDSFDPSSPEEPMEDVRQYKALDDVQNLGVLNPIKSYLFKPSTEPQTGTRDSYTKALVQDPDPISLCSSDSGSSVVTSATNASRNKRRWKKFLAEFRLEEDFSEDSSHTEPERPETPEVVEDVPVQSHFVSYDDEEDTSDCDKNTDLRFLTPTKLKSDYVEKNPAPVAEYSDNESFNSSITTAPAYSQEDDPTFKTRCRVVPAKDSPILPPKKRLKTSLEKTNKMKPQNRILARIVEPPEAPRQMTLRRFGFAPNTASTRNIARRTTDPEKKSFKLFDNDIPITMSSDDSSLFERDLRSKKQNVQQKTVKTVNLGNKRRCEECKTTFRTPTELKKHVFVVHTVEDLSDD